MQREKNVNYLTDGEIDLKIINKTYYITKHEKLPLYRYYISLHNQSVVIGSIDIIIGYNETLIYRGNIGFEVKPKYRGNSFAAKATKLLTVVARKHGLNKLYICCNPSNIASRRTCENAGAILKTIAIIPKSHQLYKSGETVACIYVLHLNKKEGNI